MENDQNRKKWGRKVRGYKEYHHKKAFAKIHNNSPQNRIGNQQG